MLGRVRILQGDWILMLAPLLISCTKWKITRRPKLTKPYVESYWESWDAWSDFPGDFSALLKDVPASPVGSCQARFIPRNILSLLSIECWDIECIILTFVISIDEAGNFAQTLVEAREDYDLDGWVVTRYSTIRSISHLVDAVNVMAYDYYWEVKILCC